MMALPGGIGDAYRRWPRSADETLGGPASGLQPRIIVLAPAEGPAALAGAAPHRQRQRPPLLVAGQRLLASRAVKSQATGCRHDARDARLRPGVVHHHREFDRAGGIIARDAQHIPTGPARIAMHRPAVDEAAVDVQLIGRRGADGDGQLTYRATWLPAAMEQHVLARLSAPDPGRQDGRQFGGHGIAHVSSLHHAVRRRDSHRRTDQHIRLTEGP